MKTENVIKIYCFQEVYSFLYENIFKQLENDYNVVFEFVNMKNDNLKITCTRTLNNKNCTNMLIIMLTKLCNKIKLSSIMFDIESTDKSDDEIYIVLLDITDIRLKMV